MISGTKAAATSFQATPDASTGATSRASIKPSARRSTPAQATITPLSVHSCGGGHTSSAPLAWHTSCNADRSAMLRATPPATTTCTHRGSSFCAQVRARRVRSATWATAVAWNDAAMSARITARRIDSLSLHSASATPASTTAASPPAVDSCGKPNSRAMVMRAAVLRPAKENSHVSRWSLPADLSGAANGKRLGSPPAASASSAGPPPPPTSRPSKRAVLSNASPRASSRVAPKTV